MTQEKHHTRRPGEDEKKPLDPVSQQGRSGGDLQRDIATQDELDRATDRPTGKTRVRKSDEREKEGGQ